jgi:hydrogenase maturation protein HypF
VLSKRIHVAGVVQGVGFRPFVYNLAGRYQLRGEVRNTSAGVDIAVEGDDQAVQAFVLALRSDAPPLARIEALTVVDAAPGGFASFAIGASQTRPGAFQPVSPDVALCADCERELFDPDNRRYLYPFINCTHCGPRFTIIRDLPYDRAATTMADFPLCAACQREYDDPADRRFHAQPVACPDCGPQVELWRNGQTAAPRQLAAVLHARGLLSAGAILAVKGLGGFHLACDAGNVAAVAELRRRKGRVGKPFAVMLADLATVEEVCHVSPAELGLLTGREKPIVLLARRPEQRLAAEVSSGLTTLGVMLPYTPLHHLLLNQSDPVLAAEPAPRALVMTSGNVSEEPLAAGNDEALARLGGLADAFLLHNRDIYLRCDDSVLRVIVPGADPLGQTAEREAATTPTQPATLVIRRARGYAPCPVHLPFEAPPVLAVGGELKNTFCLTRDRYAFLSQHIGDMQNLETLAAFEQNVAHLARLFHIEPAVIAHDLHPDYLSTRWAQRQTGAQWVGVQHHHAHIAAVMADNGLDGSEPVIGLAFDGTGYGTDGAIWGGEFLIADYSGFRRAAHLEYLPLPGGDAATRKPWRIALGYAAALGLHLGGLPFLRGINPGEAAVVRTAATRRLNAPLTSSMGRLFDAVAALANVRAEVSYEAQAAIELEALAQPALSETGTYPYRLDQVEGVTIIRLAELLDAVRADVAAGQPAGRISARFHRTIATLSVALCQQLRVETGLARVALSGGVWQNLTLLRLVCAGLRAAGFSVYTHQQVPPNDGGLALGQAAVAARQVLSQ